MFSEEKKERKINEVFAAKHDLSIDQINDAAKEEFEKLNPEDFASDDARWGRALRRARGGFRAIAARMKNSKDGMIVCRFRDNDFARGQYNRAKRVEALEGKEEAIKQGLMNEDGQPIFKYGSDIGKIIETPSAFGGAAGYFIDYGENGDRIITPKYINIGKDHVENNIPICQIGRLSTNDAQKAQLNYPYSESVSVWYNASTLDPQHRAPYNAEEITEILLDWNAAFGVEIPAITTEIELMDFGRDHCCISGDEHKYDFCYLPGRIVQIVVPKTQYDDIRIVIEFLDSVTLQDRIINTFIPRGAFQGLFLEEDLLGICILQSYDFRGNENNTMHKWHLGGFLPVRSDVEVEKFFGVTYEDDDEDV